MRTGWNGHRQQQPRMQPGCNGSKIFRSFSCWAVYTWKAVVRQNDLGTTIRMLEIEKNLWPLTLWLNVFGFHMGPRKAGTNRYCVWLLITGSLMVISTVGLHCTSFVRSFLRFRANGIVLNGTNLTTANRLNVGIEHLNYTCVVVGVHVTFFFVSLTSNWTSLWNSLLVIEENLKFNPIFYRKCKKCVLIGFTVLFVVRLTIDHWLSPDCLIVILCNRIASVIYSFRFARFTGTWAS